MAEPATPDRVPSAAPAGPPPKKSSVATCLIIGLCVSVGGVLVLGILAALLIPAITKSLERAKVVACASNLHQLRAIQSTYAIQFGGRDKEYPTETGSAFWLKLTRTQPPLLDPSETDVLLCPAHGKSNPGACDYLGPARPHKSLQAGDPVGADRPGNHRRGGNVLRKSGDVLELLDADFSSVCDKLSP